MATVGAFSTTRTGDGGLRATSTTTLMYIFLSTRRFADRRSWTSVLRALQHPSYIPPVLKDTLQSRIKQLQNCADILQAAPGQCGTVADSVTIEGMKFDVSQQQRDLTKKLTDQLQVDANEAFKVVYQQTKIGVSEIDQIVRGYLKERTSQLRVVKSLFTLQSSTVNSKVRALLQELLAKIIEDKEFPLKLVQGLSKRLELQMPSKVASNPSVALAWSRQVLALIRN
jgi:hypothetical protein